MKGIGWLPLGSLEAEKNKKAMEIISEKKYRQHPDTLKYSTLMDSMNMVLAQNNAKIMNKVSPAAMWCATRIKANPLHLIHRFCERLGETILEVCFT
jgi:nebulin